MTDYDKFLSLTKQLTEVLNGRINESKNVGNAEFSTMPRKYCKARITRLRLELNETLKDIESKCETLYLKKSGEDWYND